MALILMLRIALSTQQVARWRLNKFRPRVPRTRYHARRTPFAARRPRVAPHWQHVSPGRLPIATLTFTLPPALFEFSTSLQKLCYIASLNIRSFSFQQSASSNRPQEAVWRSVDIATLACIQAGETPKCTLRRFSARDIRRPSREDLPCLKNFKLQCASPG